MHLQPIIVYWLEGFEVKNATTGERMTRDLGPYAFCKEGCSHRFTSNKEVRLYIEERYGRKVTRIERRTKAVKELVK